MILQNTLDLSTFEIIRFRIWNQTSNPDDFGIGTKYFNTNSGHDGYNRENIYTKTGWRKTAYLDDIDKINKKLDLIFGDELDTDTIIDSWKEVQDFLSGIEDTKNLMTMLDGKLDKTGGTISKDGNPVPLTIKSTGEYAGLGLKIGENGRAVLAYYGGLDWRVTNESYQSEAKILHNFNFESLIGDTYLKTDGSNIMTAPIKFSDGSVDYDAVDGGLTLLYTSSANNAPNNGEYGRTLSVVNGSAGFQLGISPAYPTLYYRAKNGNVWLSWKAIAFTDSDITGNAATATKLKNKVSLWGNEFDGTQNLNGNLSLGGSRIFWASNSDAYYIGVSYALSEGAPNLDYCGFSGHRFLIRSNVSAMTITEEGNVVIGDAANTLNAKLKVNGLTFLYGGSNTPDLGNAPARGLAIGYPEFGISQWVNGNGQCYIQAGRFDGTATAYALNLNPLGGAVNIASVNANTNVLGTMVAHGNVGIGITDPQYMLEVLGDLCVNRGNHGPNNTTFRINCADNKVNLYAEDLDDAVCNLCFYVEGKEGMRINSVGSVLMGLGYDNGSGAKLQVVGNATFSNRVLIGGAEDDADYALNVKGDSYFDGTVYIPTGQKLTIGSVTFEEDAAGRVKVDGDMYTTGTLASGGKAKEGTGTGSGSANVRDFELPADGKTTYDCDHLLKSKNVIVQVFEKTLQNNIEVWEMILTDVTIVTEDRVTVTFGRPHNKVHRVHIIGGNVS